MSGRVLHLPHALERAFGKGGEDAKKAGRCNGRHSCFSHLRTSSQAPSPWGNAALNTPVSASHFIPFFALRQTFQKCASVRSGSRGGSHALSSTTVKGAKLPPY